MSGVSVTLDDREVQRLLNRLRARVDDMTPVMDMIGSALADNIRLTFHDGRDPWGRPWAPLSPATLAKRRKGNGSGEDRPLRDTGRLMNSIIHHATRNSVTVGTNVEYAATHQYGARKGQYGRTKRGGPIPWGDVLARPPMPIKGGNADLPAQWRDDIIQPLIRFLTA